MIATCPVCKNKFERRYGRIYCSPECASVSNADRTRERYYNKVRKTRKSNEWSIRPCFICGNDFKPKRPRDINCSPACRKKYHDLQDAENSRERYRKQVLRMGLQKRKFKIIQRGWLEEKVAKKQKEKESPIINPEIIKKPRYCVLCGKLYKPEFTDDLYCSRECVSRMIVRKQSMKKGDRMQVFNKSGVLIWVNPFKMLQAQLK